MQDKDIILDDIIEGATPNPIHRGYASASHLFSHVLRTQNITSIFNGSAVIQDQGSATRICSHAS